MREFVAGLLCIFVVCLSMTWAQEPKRLTEAEFEKELEIAEAFLKQAPTETKPVNRFIGVTAVTSVVENVGRMTDGAPLRLKAIALARKCAALPEYSMEPDLRKQERPEGIDDHQAHSRLDFAWGVLRATGVLRDGMRLEEVVGLLGQPTKVGPEFAELYYSSGMHVNPCLRWRTDGRVKGRIEETRD